MREPFHVGQEPQPLYNGILYFQQYCRISANSTAGFQPTSHIWWANTLGGNGMMMDSYAYPQHMKVVKHFS
jgi:hypothetical protein